jgi:hypothetical protein
VTVRERTEVPSRARLALATLVALLVAGIVLVTVVLPAEYGIDPLGTGEALGLIVLSGTGDPLGEITVRPDGIIAQPRSFRVDRRRFELDPGEYVEYKFEMEQGGTMVYTWTADGPVRSEMHSEPWWAGSNAQFFEVEEATDQRHGSYTAPFPGVHGWYWLNQTDARINLTLDAAGFFESSTEYVDGVSQPVVRAITTAPGGTPALTTP